jgi:hypothetical protein
VRGKAAQSETAADGDEAEPQPEPAAEEPAVEVEPAAEPEGEADAEMTLNLGERVTGSGRKEGSGETLETSVPDDAPNRPQ